MTKMLRSQLEELEQTKENCHIYLGTQLSFFGKIWRVDDDSIELIAFTKEKDEKDLATTSRWIIPIDRILVLGYGWHTLKDREQSLVFAALDLQPFKTNG